jgi:hypothetical protein
MTVLGRPMDGNFFTPTGTISTWAKSDGSEAHKLFTA